ncbi:MAG: hypothetical protein KJ971_05415, partial [Firmicutes bacterium]|nr:hypothetical protein [Bacillota bacterium]
MNQLIERYIYDVTRRLPESSRDEVKKELRANIFDMLKENPSNEEIEKVLLTLGEPRVLANEYRPKKRYLISPEWMDDYVRVLKIVMIIFASITLVVSLIENILNPEAVSIIGIIAEVFAKVVSEVVQSLINAFAIVTLIFFGIEAANIKSKKSNWIPESLPQLPKENVSKISKSGAIAELMVNIIGGTIFIFLLMKNALYLGWYTSGEGWTITHPLFTDSLVQPFIPLFIISVIFSVFVSLTKLYYGHRNIQVAFIYTLQKVLSTVLFIVFINQTGLISTAFLTEASNYFSVNGNEIKNGIEDAFLGFSIFLGIIVTID